jgi:hypothetical protein
MPEYVYTASYERWGTPPRPSDDAIRASIAALEFRHTRIPVVEELLDAFRTQYTNGGAVAARFTISGTDEAYRWFADLDRFGPRHGYDLVTCLLTSDSLHHALPDIDPPGSIGAQPLEDAVFEQVHPVEFDGQLAAWLLDGGVLEKVPIAASEAKQIGVAAVTELIDDRYEAFTIYRTTTSWANWFSDLLCATWVIIDRERDVVTVLCVTDSD